MRRYLLRFLLPPVALLAAFIFWTSAASAQAGQPGPITDDQVNAIARQLYCPVCENIPLDVCPTQACAEWRQEIRDMLSQGKTEAEIKQHFVDYYGDRVLGTPPVTGVNRLLNTLFYFIPPIAILIGAFILYRAMRAWLRPAPAAEAGARPLANDAPASGDSADPYVTRLEDELRRR